MQRILSVRLGAVWQGDIVGDTAGETASPCGTTVLSPPRYQTGSGEALLAHG